MRISVIIIAIGFLASIHIVQAQSASGQFKISNPQVTLDTPNMSTKNNLELRIGKAGMEKFIVTGGFIEDSKTSLQARVSTTLLELESGNSSVAEHVRIHASSTGNAHEFIMIRDQKLQKNISYSVTRVLGQAGISTNVSIKTPIPVKELKSFLGTIKITVGTY